jgi:hypothetical protein
MRNHRRIFERAGLIQASIIDLIGYYNSRLKKNFGEPRTGGYLVVMDAETGEIVLVMAVGEFPAEKAEKYWRFAIGKAAQLFQHRTRDLTSFESNSEEFPQGAVLIADYIWSFSGHEAEVDEAIMATVGVGFAPYYKSVERALNWIKRLEKIMTEITRNEVYPKFKTWLANQSSEPGY